MFNHVNRVHMVTEQMGELKRSIFKLNIPFALHWDIGWPVLTLIFSTLSSHLLSTQLGMVFPSLKTEEGEVLRDRKDLM